MSKKRVCYFRFYWHSVRRFGSFSFNKDGELWHYCMITS